MYNSIQLLYNTEQLCKYWYNSVQIGTTLYNALQLCTTLVELCTSVQLVKTLQNG